MGPLDAWLCPAESPATLNPDRQPAEVVEMSATPEAWERWNALMAACISDDPLGNSVALRCAVGQCDFARIHAMEKLICERDPEALAFFDGCSLLGERPGESRSPGVQESRSPKGKEEVPNSHY